MNDLERKTARKKAENRYGQRMAQELDLGREFLDESVILRRRNKERGRKKTKKTCGKVIALIEIIPFWSVFPKRFRNGTEVQNLLRDCKT